MNIVGCLNANYVMPYSVMFLSICENNRSEHLHFYIVVDNSVKPHHRKQMRHACRVDEGNEVSFVEINPDDIKQMLKKVNFVDNYFKNAATYYRLLLSEILPKDVNKVLYVDGDMICCGSLEELWNLDLEGKAIAGVIDQSCNYKQFVDYDRLGYPAAEEYFNNGTLLINLEYWRKYDATSKFLTFLKDNPEKIKMHDQDIFNITFHNCKVHLPMKYNVQNNFLYIDSKHGFDDVKYASELEEAIHNPVIVHYTGKVKPWYSDCDHPMRGMWQKYYKMSEWGNKKLKPYPITMKEKFGKILRSLHILPQLPPNEILWKYNVIACCTDNNDSSLIRKIGG